MKALSILFVTLLSVLALACESKSSVPDESQPAAGDNAAPTASGAATVKADPSTSPDKAEKPAAATPAPAPTEKIAVVRKHKVGERYTLLLILQTDEMIRSTYRAEAKVASVTPDETVFDVEVLAIVDEQPPGEPKAVHGGVILKVSVGQESIDAEIVKSEGEDIHLRLTSFENLLGDLCQPSSDPHDLNKPWKKGQLDATFTGVTTRDGVHYVNYQEQAKTDRAETRCEATISLADGFSGERSNTFIMDLGGTKSVQTTKLTVSRP
ncbi:MAG: hypothetical protein AAGC55_10940 [Myxococcota bacterium]